MASLPVENEEAESNVYICPESTESTYTKVLPLARTRRDTPGFHYIFLNATGDVEETRGPSGTQVCGFLIVLHIENGQEWLGFFITLYIANGPARLVKMVLCGW